MTGIDLVNITRPPQWMADAACAEVGGDVWFPDKGGSPRDAQRICARCPVSSECLAYALTHQERFGVWGGVSEQGRRKLARPGAPAKRAPSREVHDRTAQVRRLTGAGLSDRQVADRLGCTTRTVQRIRAGAGIAPSRPPGNNRGVA